MAELVPDPDMAAEVHEVTGGNPMFVHQFNRASIALVPSGSEARDTTTTDMLRAAIRARLALFEPEPTAVIRGLAVLGGSTEAQELAAVTGLDPPLVERQLAELALDGDRRSSRRLGRRGPRVGRRLPGEGRSSARSPRRR